MKEFIRNNRKSDNKKAIKQKKLVKQKNQGFSGKQIVEESWEATNFNNLSNQEIYTGIIAGIKSNQQGKLFQIFDQNNGNIKATLHSDIPEQLQNQIVVGDIVDYIAEDEKAFVIKRQIRKNQISRIKGDSERFSFGKKMQQCLVSNIDIGIIVASAKNPDFHSNFIDRYNVILQYGGVQPLICITKSDLKKLETEILDWYQKGLGIKVIYCSTFTGEGIDDLKNEIQGKTVVLVGNSGVGKSSLVNCLKNSDDALTQGVGAKSGQGKHTTTFSQFYQWAENSYIIDTPGIRSLELLEIRKSELKNFFLDFSQHSQNCQFKDCSHTHEPNCGVKTALEKGILSKQRYENYLRILENLI